MAAGISPVNEGGAARVYPRVGLLIDGEWIYDRPPCHQVVNPSSERPLGPVPGATAADLDRALDAARRGFALWRKESPAKRSELLHRVAALLRQRTEQIAPVITLEQGKPLGDSRAEILRSASFLDWDAEELLRTYGRTVPAEYPMQQWVTREPVGPVAAFTPWNVPMSAPSRKLSGSIAAGCSVIIKPAEETPATACLFAQCFIDAGLPNGVLNVVFGAPAEVSQRLIASPVIRMITLTGSIAVGKQLSRLAAEGMKPVLMELGGHAPVLIDEDVDPVAIARSATNSKFRMAGQICAAPTRFLVHRKVYHEFVDALAQEAQALKVGDGFEPGVQMGPVINERRFAVMAALVQDAVTRGARLVTGGKRLGERGYFYAPTVLADVPQDADVMNIEPFGPLAPCAAVADMQEALAIANRLPVGLASFLFTNSLERADSLARDLEAGVVSVNGFAYTGADTPFGGIKESGIGREGGEESLASYMVTKTQLRRSARV
jgi:succinate-semialdehyde dehydrogenase / glutarate-semialdehyde dehydrogenase